MGGLRQRATCRPRPPSTLTRCTRPTGAAVDNTRVYTSNANSNVIPWPLPGGGTTSAGVWTGINAATGQVLWQVTPSHGGGTSGPVTSANGVVYGC